MNNLQKYLMLLLGVCITATKFADAGDESRDLYTYGHEYNQNYRTYEPRSRIDARKKRASALKTYRSSGRPKYNNYANKYSNTNTNDGRSLSSPMSNPTPESERSSMGIR